MDKDTQKQESEDGWWHFVALCCSARDPEELDDLFTLFLTIEEREDLAGRFHIIKELLKGEKSQREMARDLHLSISKITRGSNSLKVTGDELKTFLKRRIN